MDAHSIWEKLINFGLEWFSVSFSCSIMKVAIALFVFALFACCLADHQESLGLLWQGTWTENKRSFGGNLYICVDNAHDVAYGSYSGVGLISGLLKDRDFTGEWFEAGYDRPFGTFKLTMGSSNADFTGSWTYYNGSTPSSDSFSWSGSRTSSVQPDPHTQCVVPARQANPVSGTYENVEAICYNKEERYQGTFHDSVFGSFVNFGVVGGYSPDGGHTVLLSDYVSQLPFGSTSDSYRPENNPTVMGPCSGCNDRNNNHNNTYIHTNLVVIGAVVSDAYFCGFFWEGFYNDQISDSAICFERTSFLKPSSSSCGTVGDLNPNADLGNTELLLSEIQSALDAITMPPVIIVPGPFDGDDDDFPPGYFDQFLTTIPFIPSSGFTPDSPASTDTTITNTQTTVTNTVTSQTTNTNTVYTSGYTSLTFSDDSASSAASVAISIAVLFVVALLI